MHRKPVLFREAKSVITESDEFQQKLLCGGFTYNPGDACAFNCEYCYVDGAMWKLDRPIVDAFNRLNPGAQRLGFRDVVIRRRKNPREGALAILNEQLDRGFSRADERLVLFTSTLVDVGANLRILRETAAACTMILERTRWDIRLLSKSPLLLQLVEKCMIPERHHGRLIFGFSTGTVDATLCRAIETGTPLVHKRLDALRWLQTHGYRTYGMLCPILPQPDYEAAADALCAAINPSACEHVWGEVINPRGSGAGGSLVRTANALDASGFAREASRIRGVTGRKNAEAWEQYAQSVFLALKKRVPPEKLRFLQYVTPSSNAWWQSQRPCGAVPLGSHAQRDTGVSALQSPKQPRNLAQEAIAQATKDFIEANVPDRPPAVCIMTTVNDLTDEELALLDRLETDVHDGLKASICAAKALYRIYSYKDGRLWKARGFDTFPEYCRKHYGYLKSHAYRLVDAGQFVNELEPAFKQSPIGDWMPRNEGQIRGLLALPREERVNCWKRVIAEKPPQELTGAFVSKLAREHRDKTGVKSPARAKPKIGRAVSALDALRKAISETPSAALIRPLIDQISTILLNEPAGSGTAE